MELNKEIESELAIRLNLEILIESLTDIIDRAINLKDKADDTWHFITENHTVDKINDKKTQAGSSLETIYPF